MRADGVGIGGKIEYPPYPRDDLWQRRHVGKPDRDVDPVLVGRRNRKHAAIFAKADAAPVAIPRNHLDAGNGAVAQK
jgi:hypothetical protein